MSILKVDQIQGRSSNTISLSSENKLYIPGQVVQCQVVRVDTQHTYSYGTTNTGIEMTNLRVAITPKFSSSMILCMFQIFGEPSNHNTIFKVFKNGTVPTGTYAGFNTTSGETSWSGIAMALPYETDYNSTPFSQTFYYHDFPNSTSQQTYAPGVKDSNNNNRTWYLNRPAGSAGTGIYETGVSFAIAWEIAQ